MSNDNVWALCEDRDGVLWVGTYGGGLNRFNRTRENFTRFIHRPTDPNSIDDNHIRVIYEDRRGTLWIGTETAGLVKFDKNNRTFKSYMISNEEKRNFGHNSVRAIVEGEPGILWIGTFGGGLYQFDIKKALFNGFQHEPGQINSLSSNQVQALHLDSQGILWIGTFSGGLNRFDAAQKQFSYFSELNSGLPNNAVYSILEDAHSNLWLSTNRGIARFDKIHQTFKAYDVDDGLQSKEFNGQAFFKNSNGEMFFGGIKGLNVFHPDSVADNPYVPKIAITEFMLFQEPVRSGDGSPLKKHISETRRIDLSHDQNDISFEFVVLHYNQPDKNQYAYMLDNYDRDWRLSGTQRSATYTNLDPGKYVFRVKGTNNDGVWSHKDRTVEIFIHSPWWLTVWAFLGYTLLLGIGIYGVHRYQRRRVINMEREKMRAREATLRAQTAEAEARAIKAENARKTHELEEARALQLSMLPKQLPQLPHLDIAVHMQTATEVGGDYYDFRIDEHGHLTVVVGDATGHGLNAGMMVSVTKSLFIADVFNGDHRSFLNKCSHTIRQLQLGNLYMAMTLVKIINNELIFSAAGMPPAYVYRAKSKIIEEILIKGMPLGAVANYDYQERRVTLQDGDTILLLTDGLPEMFNEHKQMFDYHRVEDIFKRNADQSAQQVIDRLVEAGRQWRPHANPNDDVTFVVIKIKEQQVE